jgi:hypothetical protein
MGGSRRSCSWFDLLEGFPLEWERQPKSLTTNSPPAL